MLEHLNPKPVKPARVVIVGAGGFVGSAIAKRLGTEGVPVLALTRKELDLLAEGASSRIRELVQPEDSVVMVSALAPAKTVSMLMQNLKMAEAVCDALADTAVAHFVYISSDAVYSDSANPVTERSCCQPSAFHGMMHAARELIFRTTVKAPLAILRPSLLYGAGDPHNGYGPNRFRRLAAKGEAITLFGEGEEMRDHVFIDDVGRIVALTLSHRSVGVLNVATGVSTSFRRVAETAAAQYTAGVAIHGTPRQNPVTHRHFDITDCLKSFPTFRYTALVEGLSLAVAIEGR